MLSVRCKCCGVELVAHPTKVKACGCNNTTTVVGDKITAVDLSQVLLLNSNNIRKKTQILSDIDLKYQEERRKRKVRKIDFEER